jgi:hypothetical protein
VRQHEYVVASEFPLARTGCGVRRDALKAALYDLEEMEVGDALRLPIAEADRGRLPYLAKIVHTYCERLGCRMAVQTRIVDGWLYIRKKTDEPRRRVTIADVIAERQGQRKMTPLAERCYRRELERERGEGKRRA